MTDIPHNVGQNGRVVEEVRETVRMQGCGDVGTHDGGVCVWGGNFGRGGVGGAVGRANKCGGLGQKPHLHAHDAFDQPPCAAVGLLLHALRKDAGAAVAPSLQRRGVTRGGGGGRRVKGVAAEEHDLQQ